MALSQEDRIAFSLNIVSADSQIAGLNQAKAQLQAQVDKLAKLDTGNANLFSPVNSLVDSYHSEYGKLDGIARTSILEQDIQDSANKKLKNFFFPNDTTTTVPSLSSNHNVWTKIKPFALTYAIGKNYTETYGSTAKEPDLIAATLALISSASANTDIQNTTGQTCTTGVCSLPGYTTSATCIAATPVAGVWTPSLVPIADYAPIHTLVSNLTTAINSLKTFLTDEVASIPTTDPDSGNQTLNNTAISNINTAILAAINAWLAYSDFNTAHGQTDCPGFNGYNSNLLAPTKLHSTQLTALQTALNSRSTFITTRLGQLSTIVGTIVQDIATGDITSSSGLYGKRYGFLTMRLNLLDGSLSKVNGLNSATSAQTSIISSMQGNKATYLSILPTSMFKAPGNGTNYVSLVSAAGFSVSDTVYVMAEGQEELTRTITAISGDTITLNDAVPSKYRPAEKARVYKDLS